MPVFAGSKRLGIEVTRLGRQYRVFTSTVWDLGLEPGVPGIGGVRDLASQPA
ncbi:MAG: hypothetical protein ACR2FU_17280 [Streptosporangiaceae bacterium]